MFETNGKAPILSAMLLPGPFNQQFRYPKLKPVPESQRHRATGSQSLDSATLEVDSMIGVSIRSAQIHNAQPALNERLKQYPTCRMDVRQGFVPATSNMPPESRYFWQRIHEAAGKGVGKMGSGSMEGASAERVKSRSTIPDLDTLMTRRIRWAASVYGRQS